MSDFIWVEKYRPKTIEECILPENIKKTFHKFAGEVITCYCMVESFTRAMPDEFKHNTSIDTFTAYKNYIRSKPWVASNYLRDPSRKPWWV